MFVIRACFQNLGKLAVKAALFTKTTIKQVCLQINPIYGHLLGHFILTNVCQKQKLPDVRIFLNNIAFQKINQVTVNSGTLVS